MRVKMEDRTAVQKRNSESRFNSSVLVVSFIFRLYGTFFPKSSFTKRIPIKRADIIVTKIGPSFDGSNLTKISRAGSVMKKRM